MNTTAPTSGAATPNASDSPQASSPTGIIAATIIAAVLFGFSVVYAAFILPRFMVLFEDFGAELPSITIMVINGRMLIPLPALLIGLAMVFNEVLPRITTVPPAVRWLLRILIFLVLMLFVFVVIAAIFLPTLPLTAQMNALQ